MAAAGGPATLRDIHGQRPRWADLRDSQSSNSLPDPAATPPAALVEDSQVSYQDTQSQGDSQVSTSKSSSASASQRRLAGALERLATTPERLATAPASSSQGHPPAGGAGAAAQRPGASSSSRAAPSAAPPLLPLLPLLPLEETEPRTEEAAPAGHATAPETANGTTTWTPNANAPEFVPAFPFSSASSTSAAQASSAGRFQPEALQTAVRRRRDQEAAALEQEQGRYLRRRTDGGAAEAAAREGQERGENVSEEDWQRRRMKRRSAVATIKTSPEYHAYVQRRRGARTAVPGTPEPADRRLSKRMWEQQVMQWRTALRRWCEEEGVDLAVAISDSEGD